ncbi:cation:proton antiporter [Skermanella sp. TT6]|uniref:Cation:proton antiporter n=1 Tax=Skermanella cutis TaxID=2775420 RepID=A0ABX7B1M1_9PROT|nr:cation:proton antiporter [Skermanella sp. TT6]QQP88224.1 cation:proton antiporter [Skermanella sp. TT6]
MNDLILFILVISALLVVASVLQPLADRLRLPHSVLLAAVGVAIAAAAVTLVPTGEPRMVGEAASAIAEMSFSSSTYILVFLPALLFQAALTIDVRRMMEDAAPILLLAVVAVFVATAVIGLALWPLAGVPLVVCLMLGSIVATTDPAAVIAIFCDIGAPARLVRLVEGESLLNDAAAIAIFYVLLEMIVSGDEPDLLMGVWDLALDLGGGTVLGIVGARLAVAVIPLLRGRRTAEVTLTLALPYLIYVTGDHFLGVSGVVAVAVAGLVFGAGSRSRLSPSGWAYLDAVWEQVAFLAGSLVFILAALMVPKLLVGVSAHDGFLLLVMVVAALVARALVLFLLLPPLTLLKLSARISNSYKLVLTWGGLRGAVTLALALSVTEARGIEGEEQRLVTVLATGFVLFTLFVNGTTLRTVIKLLGLNRLSPLNQALRTQVLALSLAEVRDSVQETAQEYEFPPTVARAIQKPYDARIAEVTSAGSLEERISDRDRITLGLISLANRERQLVLEHHGLQTVPGDIIEALLRNAGEIYDGARTGGRIGYNRAARKILRLPRAFRFAYSLHRWTGVERPLARQVSKRFDKFLVRRLVLEELIRFNSRSLKPLLGDRVAELLGEVLGGRMEASSKALDALELQYPEYAEALSQRFLRKFALRREIARYESLFHDGLIGQELFEDLRRGVEVRRREADRRPKLDLRLDKVALIAQVPLFNGLEPKDLARLAKILRSRLALPDQTFIRTGDRGNAMYFISSGAVEVVLPDRRIRLGRGDFFGEMALLDGGPRRADVVALTYCTLLELRSGDFRKFLKANPHISERIDQVARERGVKRVA